MSALKSIYEAKVKTAKGEEIQLDRYKGKVLLIVNVASQCGFTPQYTGLQSLYTQFQEQGLEVLGFPCNQFGGQEPGSETEIQQFCELNYSTTFPIFAKIDVNGADAHPLFEYLKKEEKGFLGTEGIKWNFTKFLVDRSGKVVARFAPTTKPEEIAGPISELLLSQ